MMRANLKKLGNEVSFYSVHFLAVNIVYLTIKKYNLWVFFNVPVMTPNFADLRAITAQVSCSQDSVDYSIEGCDPWGRKIGMLQVWLPLFRLLNFNESKTTLIANSLQVLFFFAIYLLAFNLKMRISKIRNFIPFTLILFSPPIALLIERGQTEMFFYSLLTFCVLLVRGGSNLFAFLLIGALSLLKIYPLILVVVLLLFRPIKKKIWDVIFGIVILGVGALILFNLRDSVLEMMQASVSDDFGRTFGVKNIPYLIEMMLNRFTVTERVVNFGKAELQIIGYTMFCMALLTVVFFNRVRKVEAIKSHISSDLILITNLVFMTMLFVSYFLVSSYDYRMLYFIPVFLCYLKIAETAECDGMSYLLAIFILLLMWAQYEGISSALVQPFLLLYFSSVSIRAWLEFKRMYMGPRFTGELR